MFLRLLSPLVLLLLALTASAATFTAGGPVSTNNDDTCDVGLFPAATLLLPYFEVDIAAAPGAGETTLFTVTNVSPYEHAALVTLWTDYGYPALSFNIYLTGYDVQSINLYDVFTTGRIAPPRGTGTDVSHEGDFSRSNNNLATLGCGRIASSMPAETLSRIRQAFALGRIPASGNQEACLTAGRNHVNRAVGYATIDVARACGSLNPSDAAYYTDVIGFDNVLMGDWIQIDRTRDFAESSNMVHIRAIPEGETPGVRSAFPELYASNFPQTFYGRFSGASKADGRQPLPSLFATRVIEGGPGGFETSLGIWRQPTTGTNASCASYARNVSPVTEFVRFDEDENPVAMYAETGPVDPPPTMAFEFPSASRAEIQDDRFPQNEGGLGGWLYLNLDDLTTNGTTQAWVTATMRSEGRYSVGLDAIAFGNGCTPAPGFTEISNSNTPLGPAPNVNP